jgi:flagellar biosynthesis protein FlhG
VKNIIPIQPRTTRPGARRREDSRPPRVIAITSGKGGVGKTNVTSNLAIALARQGNRVCIFDADTNLANINIVMGLSPRYTIEHLLSGEQTIEAILAEGPEGVMIVPAASGIAECARLDATQQTRLIEALETLEADFDYLLIDTAAGIGSTVLSFIQSAQYMILVISTEPTSLTDAFALLRMLKRRHHERPAYVLVNMALNYANSMEIFKRFEAAVRKYLSMKVHYLGYITEDRAVKTSVSRQNPVLLDDPDALASRCFTTLAAVLSKQFTASAAPHGFSAWWKYLADTEPAAETAAKPEAPVTPPAPTPAEPVPPVELPPAAAPAAAGREAGAPPDAASELQALAARAHALLADPSLNLERSTRFLDPLIEIYLSRFHRIPPQLSDFSKLLGKISPSEAELYEWAHAIEDYFERRFGKPLHAEQSERERAEQEQRERVIREYRAVAERLEAEQALLHQTLTRLYDYIDEELTDRRDSRRDDPMS